MADLTEVFRNMLETIINAIPAILAAIIIIALGYIVGSIVGKAVNYLVGRLGLERAFDQTTVGRSFRSSGLDMSNLIGSFVKAFIVILSLILAIEVMAIGGILGEYLVAIADYLPKLLAGILIIILGSVFADFLSSFIGNMIKPMFPENKVGIADMLRNLLFIGLIAFVILLALDTMLLGGSTIYPLILGFVIIGVGITMTDGLIKTLMDEHSDFSGVAGYAKFVLYSIFLVIGAGAIFANFSGVTQVIANISWAFSIALAIILIPVAFGLLKKVLE
ncbi:MAG: hypothetical protein GX369_05030 [Euryarchaeota archaeon]|nr:hypothetical protein [Euryarchaeota archaeon]